MSELHLHVLGKSPAWPGPGADEAASSGYLLTSAGGERLLVDCGHGIAGKLRHEMDYHDLTAVVLTHLHMDHCADLTALAYALLYEPHPRQGVRPELIVGPGFTATLRQLGAVWDSPDMFERAFRVREHQPGRIEHVGSSYHLRFALVPHPVPTYAVAINSGQAPTPGDPAQIAFSADCGLNQNLVELATGCGLLICEATMPEHDDSGTHLCAREAGVVATQAGAGSLLLTHYSDLYDVSDMIDRASNEYSGGLVHAARGGMRITVA